MPGGLSGRDALSWETDELGAVARVLVDTSVYSKTAVFKTAYWYTDRCYLFLSTTDDPADTIQVEVRPKEEASRDELVALCREFCNSLIDQQVRQDVIAETGSIRETLVKKAFFEGGKHPDSLRSKEDDIPAEGQSYEDDPLKIGRITGA
jgi:His-Xaa-Ser system protein HxsD